MHTPLVSNDHRFLLYLFSVVHLDIYHASRRGVNGSVDVCPWRVSGLEAQFDSWKELNEWWSVWIFRNPDKSNSPNSRLLSCGLSVIFIGDRCGIARDISICAPTGSGKTLVLTLPCYCLFPGLRYSFSSIATGKDYSTNPRIDYCSQSGLGVASEVRVWYLYGWYGYSRCCSLRWN